MRKLPNESGQALLLILLSMAVILTVVLSIVARTTTDITITSREEEALRAFSAAEAGIEKALFIGTSVSGPIGDASFNAQVTGTGTSVKEFSFPNGLTSGDSLIAWFVNHDSNNNLVCSAQYPCFTGSQLKICWGASATPNNLSTTPAIEASVFYTSAAGDYSTAKIARVAIDPNPSRLSSNNFQAPNQSGTCNIGSDSFAFQHILDFSTLSPIPPYGTQNGLQYARIRMLYNTDIDQPVGISANFPGDSLLPPQGLTIVSTGTAGSSNRKVEVFQGFASAPSIFDAAVFSPSGITK